MNPSSPSNSQNYNRFSYVLNNPLKYVDPSGYVALNPWYEYQAGPKTFYTWMPDYHTDGTYPDNQGRIWKYHGETINTPGFYGDETGMWISKLNEHNELIYNYNELRQVVQNNANSNSFFSSFSMGAGTFRVEGEMGRGNEQGGKNNSLEYLGVVNDIALITAMGHNALDNGLKRKYAHQLSKHINTKSGVIYQSAKSLGKSSKILLGKAANIIAVGSITYDFGTGNANTSTLLDAGMLIGGVATVAILGTTAAPFVVGAGIVYGVGCIFGFDDYLNKTFDISKNINFINNK
jgi:hypothetical protein